MRRGKFILLTEHTQAGISHAKREHLVFAHDAAKNTVIPRRNKKKPAAAFFASAKYRHRAGHAQAYMSRALLPGVLGLLVHSGTCPSKSSPAHKRTLQCLHVRGPHQETAHFNLTWIELSTHVFAGNPRIETTSMCATQTRSIKYCTHALHTKKASTSIAQRNMCSDITGEGRCEHARMCLSIA